MVFTRTYHRINFNWAHLPNIFSYIWASCRPVMVSVRKKRTAVKVYCIAINTRACAVTKINIHMFIPRLVNCEHECITRGCTVSVKVGAWWGKEFQYGMFLIKDSIFFSFIFLWVFVYMYLCRPSEASTRYCAIPAGYPPQDWQSLPCAGEELDLNPGLLICSQVHYHWATSPPHQRQYV
jgi:hypothetical protein